MKEYLQTPAVFPKFQWHSAALMDTASVLRAGKELVKLGKDPSLQRQDKHPWMLPACELFDTSVKGAEHSQSQMEGNQHPAVTVIDSSSHTSKGRVIPFCHPSPRDLLPELHFSASFLLRTIHMSTHGSCSPPWISCICSSLDGTFLSL